MFFFDYFVTAINQLGNLRVARKHTKDKTADTIAIGGFALGDSSRDIKPTAQKPRGESIRTMVADTVYSDFITRKAYHFSRIMQGFFYIFKCFFCVMLRFFYWQIELLGLQNLTDFSNNFLSRGGGAA